MENLTTRRIYSKVRGLSSKCADHYDAVVGNKTPKEKFWSLVDGHDDQLGKSLSKRPITALEIDGACGVFFTAFQGLCRRVSG